MRPVRYGIPIAWIDVGTLHEIIGYKDIKQHEQASEKPSLSSSLKDWNTHIQTFKQTGHW